MKTLDNLRDAEQGSYYTIVGAGGSLDEWVTGYEKILEEAEIGKPVEWFTTTGAAVNSHTSPTNEHDAFPDDLAFLLFPLDGLDVGKLAMFKLRMQDRWFDDIVDNIRYRNDN